MHPIQEKLLALSKSHNLAEITLRAMAEKIGMKNESPQRIKHHLLQLERRGFLSINRSKKLMARYSIRRTKFSRVSTYFKQVGRSVQSEWTLCNQGRWFFNEPSKN